MTRIIHFLTAVGLLLAVVPGCHRAPSAAEARLIAIDTLIGTAPDSALTLLQATDTATLAEPERAYHALLTAQATYRAYIPPKNDSVVLRAWHYYSDNGSSNRRLRTLHYLGTTAEDLGRKVDAMRWYKRLELASRQTSDTAQLAFALMSMAELYKTEYSDSDAIAKYTEVLPLFERGDRELLIYSLLEMGQLCSSRFPDTTLECARRVQSLAAATADTTNIIRAKTLIVTALFYGNHFRATVDSMNKILPHDRNFGVWQYGIVSMCMLGDPDSAHLILGQSPQPHTQYESMMHYHSLAEFYKLTGKYDLAYRYETMSSDLSGSMIAHSIAVSLKEAEYGTAAEAIGNDGYRPWLWAVAAVALLAFIALSVKFVKSIRQRRELENKIKSEIYKLSETERELIELKKQINHSGEQLNAISLAKQKVQNRLEVALSKLNDRERELKDARHSIIALNKTIDSLSNNISLLESSSTESKYLLEQHKAELAQAVIEAKALSSRIAALEIEKERLIKNVANASDRLDRVQKEADAFEASAMQMIEQLNNALATAATEQETAHKRIESLKQTLGDAQKHLGATVFNPLLTAIRQKSRERNGITEVTLDITIKSSLTHSYISQLRAAIDRTYPGLVGRISDSGKLSERNLNVVCMAIAGLPNAVIALYADVQTHSVPKLKRSISNRYFGEPGRFDDFKNQ